MVLRLYYAHLHINWHSPCLATFVENGKGMPTPSNKLFRVSTLSSHLLPLQEFESTIKKKKRAKFIISALQSSGNQWVSKFQHELSRIHQPFPSSSFSRNLPTTTRKEKKGTNGLSLSQRVLQPVRCNKLSWLLWGHKCKYTELDTKSLAFFTDSITVKTNLDTSTFYFYHEIAWFWPQYENKITTRNISRLSLAAAAADDWVLAVSK